MKSLRYLIIIVILLLILFFLFFKILIGSFFPEEEVKLIVQYSEKYELDPALVSAMIHTESSFNKEAVSNKGASGYMQIMEKTAYWAAEEIGIDNFTYDMINNPEINIQIGCWYIRNLVNQFGNIETALAAYNAGSGNVSGWLDDSKYSADGVSLIAIPFNETEKYIKKVQRRKIIYDFLFNIYERG